MNQSKITIIIPALNPDEEVIAYVDKLILLGFDNFIIVDDGSDMAKKYIFDKLASKKECFVLHHEFNKGKGRSLKTAYEYFLESEAYADFLGVVTVDADGQHLPLDVIKVAEKLINSQASLILGVRDFSMAGIPLRSKIGNIVTSHMVKIMFSKRIRDTQTGLRGIPREQLKKHMELSGERFDYEINVLLKTIEDQLPIIEVPISTIYHEDNSNSHFHPLFDSIKIYRFILKIFFRFFCASFGSFIIDQSIFTLLVYFVFAQMEVASSLFWSIFIARFFSSIVNFLLNKNFVFNNRSSRKSIMFSKYYVLMICQMLLSWLFVSGFVMFLNVNKSLAKLLVDSCLFFISFHMQKKWVYK